MNDERLAVLEMIDSVRKTNPDILVKALEKFLETYQEEKKQADARD